MMTLHFDCPDGYLADYLAYLFPPDEMGRLCVSAASDLGRLMIGYAHPVPWSEKDWELRKGFVRLTLRLPDGDGTQHLRNYRLRYLRGDMVRLRDVLLSVFNLDLLTYWQKGVALGMQKKDIVEGFIVSRRLVSSDPYELIHKRVYRFEQKKMSRYAQRLSRKISAYEEAMDKMGLI